MEAGYTHAKLEIIVRSLKDSVDKTLILVERPKEVGKFLMFFTEKTLQRTNGIKLTT